MIVYCLHITVMYSVYCLHTTAMYTTLCAYCMHTTATYVYYTVCILSAHYAYCLHTTHTVCTLRILFAICASQRYLCHHELGGIPATFLGYLVGRGSENHHCSRDVHNGRRRLAKGLQFRQVGLIESVESLFSSLWGGRRGRKWGERTQQKK